VLSSAAAEIRYEVYTELATVTAEQLSEMRGGIFIAGLDLDFGALVHVLNDGTLIADTVLSMNDDGSITDTTTIVDGSGAQPFSPDNTGGVDLSAFQGAQGVAIIDEAGATFALFDIGLSHTKSFVINTAAERNIEQFVEVNITVQNFDAVQGDLLRAAGWQNLARIGMPDALTGLGN
jgi:hypothetical protein